MTAPTLTGQELATRYERMSRGDKRYQYLDPECSDCRWENSGQCIEHLMQVGKFQNSRKELREAVEAIEALPKTV